MAYRLVARITALMVVMLGVALLVPLGLALLWGESRAAAAFAQTEAVALALALVVASAGGFRQAAVKVHHREALLVTTVVWLLACGVGALPFLFSGQFGGVTESVFESVSGFTTTGASILSDIESVPKSLLLWRAMTHWIGGIGVVLLAVAILPLLGVAGLELVKVEGFTSDKLEPRVRETARALWRIYLGLTVVLVILLMIAGMGPFDAVCHSFATIATGGFSTRNTSVASFDSPWIDGILTVFMFLAATNFGLHFVAWRRGWRGLGVYLRDSEFRAYGLLLLGSSAAVVGVLAWSPEYDFWPAFRSGVFNVTSIMTTTGFANSDFEAWGHVSAFAPWLLVVLMVVGASTGSTSGAIRVARFWVLVKSGMDEVFRSIHPRAVTTVRLGRRVMSRDVVRSISAFFFLYVLTLVVGSIALTFTGVDLVTALSGAAACLGGVGPGLGEVGALDNYAGIPMAGKWVLVGLMFLGRLELYTVLVLLVPDFWRQ